MLKSGTQFSRSIQGSAVLQLSVVPALPKNTKNVSACEYILTSNLCGELTATAVPPCPGQRAGSLPDTVSPCLSVSPGASVCCRRSWRTGRGRTDPPESPAPRAEWSVSYRPGEESADWTRAGKRGVDRYKSKHNTIHCDILQYYRHDDILSFVLNNWIVVKLK